MPLVLSNTSPGVVRVTRPIVSTKYFWTDPWQVVPFLYPIQSTREVAPVMSHADFIYVFGNVLRFGAPMVKAPPLRLVDHYIKIEGETQGVRELLWVGVVVDEQVTYERRGRGMQEVKALGLEHMLDRTPIDHAWVEDVNNPSNFFFINWAPPFNERSSGRKQLVDVATQEIIGNRRLGIRPTFTHSATRNSKWDLEDVLVYLTENFASGAIKWDVTGQRRALFQFKNFVIEQEGRTALELINENISRARGIGCAFNEPLKDSGNVPIKIFTLTDVDITSGSQTLAANTTQVPFILTDIYPYTHIFQVGILRYAVSEQVYELIVQGERIEVTANFAYADGTLVEGWTASQGANYEGNNNAANLEHLEVIRSSDLYRRVYVAHVVPETWDGRCGDGVGGPKIYVTPATFDNGNVTLAAPVPNKKDPDSAGYTLLGKEFLPTLPFIEGGDYTVSPPANLNPPGALPEYAPLMVLLKDPQDDRYYYAGKADLKEPGRLRNASIRPLHREPGVHCETSPRHHISGHPVADPFLGQSLYFNEVDYASMIVVATFQSDQRQHLRRINPNPNVAERRLTITVPGAHRWIVAPNCILKLDGNGNPVRVNPLHLSVRNPRNDITRLNSVMAFASAYFFAQRQAISVTVSAVSDSPPVTHELGTFITDLVGLQLREPVKSVITSKTIHYRKQTTVTKTSFLSVDEVVAAGVAFGKGE